MLLCSSSLPGRSTDWQAWAFLAVFGGSPVQLRLLSAPRLATQDDWQLDAYGGLPSNKSPTLWPETFLANRSATIPKEESPAHGACPG